MRTEENIRKDITEAFFNHPILGKHYIDWHTEDGECGLTLIFKSTNEEFDIIIKKKRMIDVVQTDGWNSY